MAHRSGKKRGTMKLKKGIKKILPDVLIKTMSIRKEKKSLRRLQKLKCNAEQLRLVGDVDAKESFSSDRIGTYWKDSESRLGVFAIPDFTGGVNPGDRRAIYYLVSKFNPSSVLEIGTHIGASTLHIAEALLVEQKKEGSRADFVTVDIADVNDSSLKPWLQYGTTHSPLSMVIEMGYGNIVEFVQGSSLNYLSDCKRKFDFIFLDGDHSSTTVYQEIPRAVELLNPDGLILLHDYFPDLKPLWSNGAVIPGPFVATERLREEGANITVLPLGELPWTTKLHSNVTSLALLLRNH